MTRQGNSRDGTSRLRSVLAGPAATWVLTGDSITQGSQHTYGWRCYPEVLSERLRWELGRRSDVVVNTGAFGGTVDEALRDVSWRVTRFAPDVVTLMYGTNDAASGAGASRFGRDLRQFAERIAQTGAVVVLQTPPPLRWGTERDWVPLEDFVAQIRAVAREGGLLLVDHYARWLAAGTGSVPPRPWFDDDAHPSAVGQQELARALADALGAGGERSPALAADPRHT